MPDRLISMAEAARRMGRSPRTARAILVASGLPPVTSGAREYVWASHVDALRRAERVAELLGKGGR